MKVLVCLLVLCIAFEHCHSLYLFKPHKNKPDLDQFKADVDYCDKHKQDVQNLLQNGFKLQTINEIRRSMIRCFIQALGAEVPSFMHDPVTGLSTESSATTSTPTSTPIAALDEMTNEEILARLQAGLAANQNIQRNEITNQQLNEIANQQILR